MPDAVQELNFKYWTSLTRRGCVGTLKNCFNERTELIESEPQYDNYFWRMFDSTEKGACVALQTLPFGMDQSFGEKILNRYPLGPVFDNCNELNYFACEVEGPRSMHIDETEITVIKPLYFYEIIQMSK